MILPKAFIKINLPLTEKDYISGNGEGVWVKVGRAARRDYDENKAAYRCACADPRSTAEQRDGWHRNFEQAKQELKRVSALFQVDTKKLIAIHRLFFRWERVRNWARVFPMKDHYEAILRYVALDPARPEGAAA